MNINPDNIPKSQKYVLCMLLENQATLLCVQRGLWSIADFEPQGGMPFNLGAWHTTEWVDQKMLDNGLLDPVKPIITVRGEAILQLTELGIVSAKACAGWWCMAKAYGPQVYIR